MKQLRPHCNNLLILLFFLLPSFISAQVIEKNGKLNPSVDYDRLTRIDNLVNEYIKNDWEKAVVTIVVKDNQVIQYKGYGFARGKKSGTTKSSRFRSPLS